MANITSSGLFVSTYVIFATPFSAINLSFKPFILTDSLEISYTPASMMQQLLSFENGVRALPIAIIAWFKLFP